MSELSDLSEQPTRQDLLARIEELERVVMVDELTGLYNRRYFDEALQREIIMAQRHRYGLSLAIIDFDGFKKINDQLGHQQGDNALRQAAQTLAGGVRKSDIVCRIGGDEFAVIMPYADKIGATKVIRRLKEMIEEYQGMPFGFSFGMAALGPEIKTAANLFHVADQAMYQAKEGKPHG